jgi:subtilisin family serine protease
VSVRIAATLSVAISAALAMQAADAGGRPDLVLAALESGRGQYTPNELLVQFKADVRASDTAALRRGLGAQLEDVVRQGAEGRLELLRLPAGISVAEAVRGLGNDPSVEFAEPNWTYFHTANSNDPYYTNGTLWGMYGDGSSNPKNTFGSQAGDAASNNCGTVWVGIIDEGYMFSHEDLAANAARNPGEIAGNGIDDDGNGLIDDVWGWNFDGGNNVVFGGVDDDHGTHVAGTIGGVGNNGKGVSGVCHSVKLMGAKFLGRRGGTTANAIKSVDYFTDLKTRHNLNLVATNNSWGGGGFSQALQDSIERANAANILFIAAAGNDSFDCDSGSNCYPAEYPNANIIAVASITSTGAMSSFSSFGRTTVDICAPGSSIMSTLPRSSKGQVVSGYGSYSGTSMATPHVTGAAALYKARNPGATAAQVKQGIMGSALPTASCNGKVVSNGRLDVSNF